MIKKLLGIAPKLESDGSYSPSRVALKLATSDKTDFENISYTKYKGNKSKILVIFTEQKNMTMKNGKKFSTGNHPVEALLPMLHLMNAGFDFEITTPTGKPIIFEMWAFPNKDEHVKSIYKKYKSSFEKPKNLKNFIDDSFTKPESRIRILNKAKNTPFYYKYPIFLAYFMHSFDRLSDTCLNTLSSINSIIPFLISSKHRFPMDPSWV